MAQYRSRSIATLQSPMLQAGDLNTLVTASLEDDKAQDIVSIPLAGKTSLADYMVIASGTSQRQVMAMADHLSHKLKDAGSARVQIEGKDQGDWVVIDAGDIIVHLFRPEVREFYSLEKMWNGAASAKKAAGSAERIA